MSKGILDTITGLFGGHKDEDGASGSHVDLSSIVGDLVGSDLGKQLLSKLDAVKSFDPQQIQTVLSALGQSTDKQVQSAKDDLETVKHDGESFVEKLKGYASSLTQILPALLPALKSIFGAK